MKIGREDGAPVGEEVGALVGDEEGALVGEEEGADPPVGDACQADPPIRVEENTTVLIWEEPDSFPPLMDDPPIRSYYRLVHMDFDVFRCSVCHRYMQIPVYQCAASHAVCSNCKRNIPQECPVCGHKGGFSKLSAMDDVLLKMRFLCRNKIRGCPDTFYLSEVDDHSNKCLYVPIQCPYLGCSVSTLRLLLPNHIKNVHQGELAEFVVGMPEKIVMPRVCFSMVLAEDDCMFVLKKEAGGQPGFYSFSMSHKPVSPLEGEQNQYWYELKTDYSVGSSIGNFVRLRSKVETATPDKSVEGSEFLLQVPAAFFLPNGDLHVNVCIEQE